MSDDAPSLEEVQRAKRKLKNGRAAGCDNIPPELLKCALDPVSKALHGLFCAVWRCGKIPAEWKEGVKPRCFLLRSWPVCVYDACGKSSCRFIFHVK